MAGMLPGVECARRRRVWQSSSGGGATEGVNAARRPSRSLCLYVGGGRGRGRDLCSSSSSTAAAASPKAWSGACVATAAAMGSGAREAKERLDHKLRGQRQPVVLKRHEMSTGATCSGTIHRHPSPAKPHDDAACSGIHRHHSATTTPCGVLLQREVLPSTPNKKGGGGGRRFGWCRRLAGVQSEPPLPPPPAAAAAAECAVCLEELRAGDVVARLPCAHRFHWSCAVPWVQAVSRCPVCRAHARVGLAAA